MDWGNVTWSIWLMSDWFPLQYDSHTVKVWFSLSLSRWECVLLVPWHQETVRLVPRGPTSKEWCEVWSQTSVSGSSFCLKDCRVRGKAGVPHAILATLKWRTLVSGACDFLRSPGSPQRICGSVSICCVTNYPELSGLNSNSPFSLQICGSGIPDWVLLGASPGLSWLPYTKSD